MNSIKVAKYRKHEAGKRSSLVAAVRLVLSAAVLGSVAAGVFFGWADLPFDPRAVGAGAGMTLASLKLLLF